MRASLATLLWPTFHPRDQNLNHTNISMEIFCLQLETFCRCALPWALAKAIPCFKAGNLRSSARGLKTEPTWVIPCFKAGNLRTSARARKLMTTWVIPCQNTGNLRTSARARKLWQDTWRGEEEKLSLLRNCWFHKAATSSFTATGPPHIPWIARS